MTGNTAITVYANTRILDDDAALANAAARFDAARIDYSCFPQITYPETGTVLPANLDGLDIQWTDSRDDLFAVSFETTYATVDVYTTKLERTLSADAWAQLASSHDPITMRVQGMAGSSPDVACTTVDRRLLVSDKPLTGAIYSWVDDGGGVWRHDVATRGEPEPVVLFQPTTTTSTASTASVASSCAGCAISQSGSRLAVRLDDGNGAIVDFTADRMMMPFTFDEATFSPSADKLVTAYGGYLKLISDTGSELRSIRNSAGTYGLDPQLSPDGTRLVNVEATGILSTDTASLVVRGYAYDGDTFTGTTVLVAGTAGVVNMNPTWSPDGEWIAFTRTTGWGTSQPLSSIWIVKADGSRSPVQVTAASPDVEVTASFTPGSHTIGGEPFYFLTFDSVRLFGTKDLGRQIWMTTFFPSTSLVRPAFRVPFQSATTGNHVAQWANALVR
jgi:hypothetical protein